MLVRERVRGLSAQMPLNGVTAMWLVGVAVCAQPLPSPEVLEPSVRNEVEHAIALAEAVCTNRPAVVTGRLRLKEGLSATDRAIALVSSQRADGRWYDGTNDVTALALEVLRPLVPPEAD